MPYQLNRVGEENINNQGLKMTIVSYVNCHDISVRFDSGETVNHTYYSSFKSGKIKDPACKVRGYKNRVGETGINNQGKKMTIIACRSAKDIDVKFEDGTYAYGREYSAFKKGSITGIVGIDRTGEQSYNNQGVLMQIINYRNASDFDVKFEDGIILTGKRYSEFKSGGIAHPSINSQGKGEYKGYKLVKRLFRLNNPEDVYYKCKIGNDFEIIRLCDIGEN